MQFTGPERHQKLSDHCRVYWGRYDIPGVLDALSKENQKCCVPPLTGSELDAIFLETGPDIKVQDAIDILKTPPPSVNWVCENFLSEGLYYLAGKPRAGKSILALQLSASIVMGVSFLGRYPTVQGEVLYCALEDSRQRLHRRLHATQINLPGLHCVYTLPRMDAGGLIMLEKWVSQHPNCHCIMIDTFARFCPLIPKHRSVYQDESMVSADLQSFAFKHKLAMLMVHHQNKGKYNEGDTLSISGSLGRIGGSDGSYLLYRNGKHGKLYAEGKESEEGDGIGLTLCEDPLRWDYVGELGVIQQSSQRQEILRFIEDCENPPTMQEIVDGLKKHRSTVQTMVDKMIKAGVLQVENKRYSKASSLF